MPQIATQTFGHLLKHVRKRAGMTQSDLAAAVGYSVSFVCALEQNRRLPDLETVISGLVPALGLQDEPHIAAELVALAATARGERVPAAITITRDTQIVMNEEGGDHALWLPAPPTTLIGREQEVRAICNRLGGHSGRLLTLVGPPGVGKTRLALAVAEQMQRHYKDGARFVPLAAIHDPTRVVTTLLTAFGISDLSQKPPTIKLIEFLRRKELLVLLDNFEQILPAAPLVAELLAACPGLCVIVTSRERLHLRAEQRYPVPPLADAAAVALFVQCVQAVEPDFALTPDNAPVIHELCKQLDGLPLAIELIAARIDVFSPQTMLARFQAHKLDVLADGAQDMPERHRALRRAIQYSYDLLDESEQRLFRRLGVFVDGFDLAAVAYFGFDAAAVQALRNKSLVTSAPHPASELTGTVGKRRFLLLETLRTYAYEQLMANQEADEAHQQHAAYFVQFVEMVEPKLDGSQIGIWLGHLEIEYNNIRAVLMWALETGDSTTALRLCVALRVFWDRRGYGHEGKQWLVQSFAARTDVPMAVQAKALSVAGQLEHLLGNHVQAQTLVEQSVALYQSMNDHWCVAAMSLQLGGIHRKQHHYTEAERFYQQSFALFQALEDSWGMGAIHIVLGNLAMNRNDYGMARAHYEQGLALQREVGDRSWITNALTGLALLTFQQGEYDQATTYSEELLALSEEIGDREGVINALNELSGIALQQGAYARATEYLTQNVALAQELDYPPITASVLTLQGDIAFAQGDFARACDSHCQSLQIAHQLTDAAEIASGLERLAEVASAQVDADRAIRLLGAAEHVRALIGVSLPHSVQPRVHQMTTVARAQLGETVYASSYAAGYAMTADQAVAFALCDVEHNSPMGITCHRGHRE